MQDSYGFKEIFELSILQLDSDFLYRWREREREKKNKNKKP